MRKNKYFPESQRKALKDNLINFLLQEVEDARYLQHESFGRFGIIEFEDIFCNKHYFAVPTKYQWHTHGIMGVSQDFLKAYQTAMINVAKNCNAELDLKKNQWTERTLEYVHKNPLPKWLKEDWRTDINDRWKTFKGGHDF